MNAEGLACRDQIPTFCCARPLLAANRGYSLRIAISRRSLGSFPSFCTRRGPSRESQITSAAQVAIAFIAAGVEAAVGDRVFDGAVGFVRVRAIGIAAQADVGADVTVK